MANEDIASIIKEQIKKFGDELKVEQTGIVTEAGDGVARVQGLSNVKANEIVQFQNDVFGFMIDLRYTIENIAVLCSVYTIISISLLIIFQKKYKPVLQNKT